MVDIYENWLETYESYVAPPDLQGWHEAQIAYFRARLELAAADTSGEDMDWIWADEPHAILSEGGETLPAGVLEYIEEYCAPRFALRNQKMKESRPTPTPHPTPTPWPTPTPQPTPTATATPTVTATPAPTPTPRPHRAEWEPFDAYYLVDYVVDDAQEAERVGKLLVWTAADEWWSVISKAEGVTLPEGITLRYESQEGQLHTIQDEHRGIDSREELPIGESVVPEGLFDDAIFAHLSERTDGQRVSLAEPFLVCVGPGTIDRFCEFRRTGIRYPGLNVVFEEEWGVPIRAGEVFVVELRVEPRDWDGSYTPPPGGTPFPPV